LALGNPTGDQSINPKAKLHMDVLVSVLLLSLLRGLRAMFYGLNG
jgi:hypothetical protein